MRDSLAQVHTGNHILAVYQDKESEFDDAFTFLKQGLDNDEIIMLVTNSLSDKQIRKRMEKEWNVKVDQLESRDIINIRTADQWYYAHGFPDTLKIKAFWGAMTEIARIRKMRGLRVFADTRAFFEKGHATELINYESTLDSKFDSPFTAICAYDSKDIQSLTPDQRSALLTHHNPIWK